MSRMTSSPWALLGDLATRRGERAQALRDYRRALALNPRDATLAEAVRGARDRLSSHDSNGGHSPISAAW